MKKIKQPAYRKHSSGQAIVTLPDGKGRRKDFLLGPFGSKQSQDEYERIIKLWLEAECRIPQSLLPAQQSTIDLTVAEMILTFSEHVQTYYRRPDGTPTTEQGEFKLALRPLRVKHGADVVRHFDVLKLDALRQEMIDAGKLCRGVINQRIARIVRLFKWAVEKKLCPVSIYQELSTLTPLQRGRSKARETAKVLPVPDEVVEATLSFLSAPVQAMVKLQRYTAMRSSEVIAMRGIDLDRSGPIWTYRPQHHKTAYQGHDKYIQIGPKAQAVLSVWLRDDPFEYLFQPREVRSRRGKRCPGSRYTPCTYANAVAKGVIKANYARACEACKTLTPAERCPGCQGSRRDRCPRRTMPPHRKADS